MAYMEDWWAGSSPAYSEFTTGYKSGGSGMDLGSVLGAAVTGIFNRQNMERQGAINRADAQWSLNQARQDYATRYQTTAKDMLKAGLNPILAATGGFNVSGQPGIANVSGTGLAQSGSFASDYKDMTETGKIKQETELTRQKVLTEIKNTEVRTQEGKAAKLKFFQAEADFYETVAKVKQIYAQRDLLLEQAGTQQALQKQYDALTKQAKMNTGLLEQRIKECMYQLNKLAQENEVYAGFAGKVLTYMREITKSTGLNIGLIPGLKGVR